MTPLPIWKLKRELRATYDQITAFVIQIFFPLLRLRSRVFIKKDFQVFVGQHSLGKRVVVYLIFPGESDLSDRLDAIKYLAAQDASVICVVNGDLPSDWVDKFVNCSAYLLIRENKGYDFGGYKSALFFLRQLEIVVDHLHIINDSVLMPMVNNYKIVNSIEAAALSGFGGATSLASGKRSNTSESSFENHQLILSYWLYFSGAVIKSKIFTDYWDNYLPTNSKVLTVRYGERGLSSYMAKHGLQPSALYTFEMAKQLLKDISPASLLKTLKYASFTDEDFSKKCDTIIQSYQSTEMWSVGATDFIEEVARRRNFLHSFCYLAYAILRIPYVKKTRIRLPLLMRQKYVLAVNDGVIEKPDSQVWERVQDISR